MATLKEQIAALQKGWSAEIANQEQPGIQTDIKTGSLSFDNKNWMVFQYPGGGVTVLRRSPNQAGLGANSYRAEILNPETGKVEETVVSPSRVADIGGKVLLATMAVLAANPQLAASLGGAEAAAAAAGELAGADLAIALGEGIQPIASTAAQAGAVGSNLASLGAALGLPERHQACYQRLAVRSARFQHQHSSLEDCLPPTQQAMRLRQDRQQMRLAT